MISGSVRHEWGRLARVRAAGLVLGASVAAVIGGIASVVGRGVLASGTVAPHPPRDLVFEILPATLALAVWPLTALMATALTLAGPRAHEEWRALDTASSRAARWRARVLASGASTAFVVAVTGGLATLAAVLAGPSAPTGWARWLVIVVLGLAAAILSYAGGLLASSIVSSPLLALLAGSVLGVAPALAAAALSRFDFARVGGVSLGILASALLVPAYPAASWAALCAGGSARARMRRAALVLGGSAAAAGGTFLIGAPLALRANAAAGVHIVYAARHGGTAYLGAMTEPAWGAGWIFDVESGRRRAFVPPPVLDLAWSPDGSRLAVLTTTGALRGIAPHGRIEIRSAADGRKLRSITIADGDALSSLTWVEDGLVAIVWRRSPAGRGVTTIAVLDPASGAVRLAARDPDHETRLSSIETTDEGRLFARAEQPASGLVDPAVPRGAFLLPIDVAAARVGAALAGTDGEPLRFADGGGLSPSGRFGRVVIRSGSLEGVAIVDLREGASRTLPSPTPARWIPGDRLLWSENLGHRTRLFIAAPGAPPTLVREWIDAQIGVQLSPDRRAAFVSALPAGGARPTDARRREVDPGGVRQGASLGTTPEEIVVDLDELGLTTLSPPFSDRANDLRYSQWAAPGTLARFAPGVVYVEDLGPASSRRFVIGSPSDLE
jgi:hypothetical protein